MNGGQPESDYRVGPERRNAQPEHGLQTLVTKFVRLYVPTPHFYTGIDRSQASGKFTHAREKSRGIVAGFCDTILLLPGKPLIAIELKAPGRHPTDRQYQVGEAIKAAGGIWAWCSTVTGYADLLRDAGVTLHRGWDLAAAGHDATLAGAAIRRDEAGGVVSKRRRAPPKRAEPHFLWKART